MSASYEKVVGDLRQLLPQTQARIKPGELMRHHTSFRIGGPADIFFEPVCIDEIITIKQFCQSHHIPCTIVGRGSNILVSDRGIRGIVVSIADTFSGIEIIRSETHHGSSNPTGSDADVCLSVKAGTRLSSLATFSARNSLGGLEFASGIPGTLGGAVIMNAGAYDGCMADVILTTRFLDSDGRIKEISRDEHQFSYRHSRFMGQSEIIIIQSEIVLKPADQKMIFAKIDDYTTRRNTTQPLNLPSAGSAFKRPAGYYAGKLIAESGLQGHRIGDAQVSLKHAGFIVNLGDATACDVKALFMEVRNTVLRRFDVELVPEVRFIGEWCC